MPSVHFVYEVSCPNCGMEYVVGVHHINPGERHEPKSCPVCCHDVHYDLVQDGTSWQMKAIDMMKANKKVAAIKHCRETTGWGLREAKNACETLYDEFLKHKAANTTPPWEKGYVKGT